MSMAKSLGPIVVVLLLIGFPPYGLLGFSSVHKVYATNRAISLDGYATTGWNGTSANPNPTITVAQGDTLIITTSSGDTSPHHFFVDVNGGGMTPDCYVDKCATVVPPTHTDSLSGFSQGTYSYYCEYHPAMKGTFIVQAAPVTPDFGISSDRPSLSITVGSSGNATITVTSQNGFSGEVNLTGAVSPSGLKLSFNPVSLSLTSGSSATSTVTVATISGLYSETSTGSYTVTITGSASPSQSHSVALPVTVNSTSSPTAPIPLTVLAIAVVTVVAVASLVAFVVLRRKPGK